MLSWQWSRLIWRRRTKRYLFEEMCLWAVTVCQVWLAGWIGQSTNGTRQFKLVNFTRDNSSSAESTLSIRRLVNPSGPVVTNGNLPLIFVSGKLRKCLSASYWPLYFPDFHALPQSHKGGVTLVVFVHWRTTSMMMTIIIVVVVTVIIITSTLL